MSDIIAGPDIQCQKCGHTLSIGEFPFCPHELGHNAVFPDDLPGGLVMEHVEPGRKVYSRSELKKVLASKGWMLDDHKTEKEFAKVLKESREKGADTRKNRLQP